MPLAFAWIDFALAMSRLQGQTLDFKAVNKLRLALWWTDFDDACNITTWFANLTEKKWLRANRRQFMTPIEWILNDCGETAHPVSDFFLSVEIFTILSISHNDIIQKSERNCFHCWFNNVGKKKPTKILNNTEGYEFQECWNVGHSISFPSVMNIE